MEAALVPCEMRSQADSVRVILRPAITQASWSDVEAFGTSVRQELEKRASPACLVDLSPMTYMGSAIVALIVRIWKVVQAQGGKMVIVCPDATVLEVIRLAGLDKIWTIVSEPEAAEKKLGLQSSVATSVRAARFPLLYFVLGVTTALFVLLGILLFLSKRWGV